MGDGKIRGRRSLVQNLSCRGYGESRKKRITGEFLAERHGMIPEAVLLRNGHEAAGGGRDKSSASQGRQTMRPDSPVQAECGGRKR